jgi:hypothetical protein
MNLFETQKMANAQNAVGDKHRSTKPALVGRE